MKTKIVECRKEDEIYYVSMIKYYWFMPWMYILYYSSIKSTLVRLEFDGHRCKFSTIEIAREAIQCYKDEQVALVVPVYKKIIESD